MNTRKTLTTLTVTLLAVAATGCELQPGQPDHIEIGELEAPWVQVTPPTQLWVQMITEGDFKNRCVTNFGGIMFNDSRGFICEVGARPTPASTTVVP